MYKSNMPIWKDQKLKCQSTFSNRNDKSKTLFCEDEFVVNAHYRTKAEVSILEPHNKKTRSSLLTQEEHYSLTKKDDGCAGISGSITYHRPVDP